MVATDARPVPIKATAFRVTFPILDADGDPVTGAAALDSEISKDGAAFTDCTAEATEIATSSGIYFLDLSAAEMTADTVAIRVQTSTAGAKTTVLVIYPQEAGDIRVDVQSYTGHRSGTLVSAFSTGCTLDAGASAVNSYYLSAMIVITGGLGAGQARFITSYTGVTKSVSIYLAWATIPDSTSTYTIVPFDVTLAHQRLPGALVGGRMDSSIGNAQANVLTAASTAADYVTELQAGLALASALAAVAAQLPASLTAAGNIKADALAIGASAEAVDRLRRSAECIAYGVVAAGSSLGTVATSALSPPAVVGDQFKGRVLLFARDTTTAALRGQGAVINASTSAGVLTVTPLTTAPVAGDTFSIV